MLLLFSLEAISWKAFFIDLEAKSTNGGFRFPKDWYPEAYPSNRGKLFVGSRALTNPRLFINSEWGVFSANAIPPYRSWSVFSPEVEAGIDILLAVRDDAEKQAMFNPVTLRYIDAFRPDLIRDRRDRSHLNAPAPSIDESAL
jgi:hypothetical protein